MEQLNPAPVKVVSIPDHEKETPYYDLFFKALAPYGIELVRGGKFYFFYFLKNLRHFEITHIHWQERILGRRNFPRRIAAYMNFFAAVFLFKITGKKLVWTCHNLVPHDAPQPSDWFHTKLAARFSDLILCHSSEVMEKLLAVKGPGTRICCIPHGSYAGYYKNDLTRQEARQRLKIPESRFMYLSFGMIREYKGSDLLIKAFDNIQRPDDLLYFAGAPNAAFYQNKIKPQVERMKNLRVIPVFIKEDDVQVYFNACDVVVYPFREITTSGTLMLSYTFAKPVIISDSPLARQMLDERAAVFFTGKEGLEEALKQVRSMDLEKASAVMREKGKLYTWDAVIGRAAEHYLELAGRK